MFKLPAFSMQKMAYHQGTAWQTAVLTCLRISSSGMVSDFLVKERNQFLLLYPLTLVWNFR